MSFTLLQEMWAASASIWPITTFVRHWVMLYAGVKHD